MKDFVKMTLAVVCGFFLLSILSIIISIGFIGSLAAAGTATVPIPSSGILKMDMSKLNIVEQEVEDPLALLQGQDIKQLSIYKAVESINKAAADPAIKCIYILPDNANASISSLEEIRAALSEFRKSGKPVVAYTESPSTGSYYLASVSDKIYMTSHMGAAPMINGVSSQMVFLKDLLDKLGVNVQLIRHGKYKSAGETFVRSESSKENLEQNQAMVNSLWNTVAAAVASSREISVEELDACIDNLSLCEPQDFVDNKLVDELLTRDQLRSKLTTLAVKENFKEVRLVNVADYAAARIVDDAKVKGKIAVIYVDGQIVDGDASQQVAGDRFASEIIKVREDADVKAVVLRVNSPGGSVLASEKIKAELDLLRQSKTLVASYGSYAASGGYWISANCDKIFSDATTLTGSIGVFSMIPDLSKTLKNVAHVNVTSVSSNKHADMYSLTRALDASEYNYMLRSIEGVYDRFTGIVAQGRSLDKDYVDGIGQGRVWTGAEAQGIGLVDEIGGLRDAINWARTSTGSPESQNWNVVGYPAPLSPLVELLSKMAGTTEEEILIKELRKCKEVKMVARMPYEITLSY